jgi:hypothetical protein
MQPESYFNTVVSFIFAYEEVHSIQLCDKVCQCHVRGFLPVLMFPSISQSNRHDIAEIVLKVLLSTNNPKPLFACLKANDLMYTIIAYFFSFFIKSREARGFL